MMSVRQSTCTSASPSLSASAAAVDSATEVNKLDIKRLRGITQPRAGQFLTATKHLTDNRLRVPSTAGALW